jgi:long-chain acyl-CoA synthetase
MSFNLAVTLAETAMASPAKPVAVYAGGQLTYGELDAASSRLAVGLEAAGLRPGDPVALQLPNIPQFLIAYFGILKAGCVAVPLNVMLKAPEVAFQLGDSKAMVLITWEGILGESAKGAAAAGVSEIYAVGHAENEPDAVPFERLLAVNATGHRLARRELTDTAVIVYTSGTTGLPKGAELTHIQLYMNADIPGRLFDVQPDDVVITALPLFHVFGLSSIMNVCVRFGCTMSLIPRFTAEATLTAIQRDGATIFEGVPTMFAALLSCPELGKYDVSSLRVAISGGASIPAPVLDAFEQRFGLVILEGYGMTETASTTTFNMSITDRRIYSVGKPIWGTKTEVWDEECKALPPGQENVGEVVTCGLHVMKGYLNNPAATAEVFTGDWLHTGDLGYFDEDGYLFIVSRKKELIIRGGYNVYPSEIEDVLHSHPAVAEAAVIGVPADRLGEEVMAVVRLQEDVSLLAAELVAYCRGADGRLQVPAANRVPRRAAEEHHGQGPEGRAGSRVTVPREGGRIPRLPDDHSRAAAEMRMEFYTTGIAAGQNLAGQGHLACLQQDSRELPGRPALLPRVQPGHGQEELADQHPAYPRQARHSGGGAARWWHELIRAVAAKQAAHGGPHGGVVKQVEMM